MRMIEAIAVILVVHGVEKKAADAPLNTGPRMSGFCMSPTTTYEAITLEQQYKTNVPQLACL